MKKLVSILLTLALVLTFALAVPVGAQDPAVFQSGGDRLVVTQNSDGGWPWPLLTGDSAPNTPGPIAIGLAQAYRQTEDLDMYAALEAAGGFLLADDHYFTCWDGLLAVELDDILDVTTYTDNVKAKFYDKLAAGTYVSTKGGPWYTEDYIAEAGYAWDLGIGLASAVSVGIAESEIDKWITGVEDAINATPYPNPWFLTDLAGGVYGLAYAGETEFLGVSGHFSGVTTVAELAVELASMQDVSGCFDPGFDMDGQNTAYALLALNEVDRLNYMGNITRAGAYLENAQLGSGGWENYPGEGENNEMTAEALWALSMVSSSSVGLTANVLDIVAISVTPTTIDFGTLKPGEESAVKSINVENIGTHTVDIDAHLTTGSSDLFKDNLMLKNEPKDWADWAVGTPWNIIVDDLAMNASDDVKTKLPVPDTYTPSGSESGTLVFEASV